MNGGNFPHQNPLISGSSLLDWWNTFLDFLNHWSSTICVVIPLYLVDLLFFVNPLVVGEKSLKYLLLQLFITYPIFS